MVAQTVNDAVVVPVLAVGLVIDDAIVVVENVARHHDAGQARVEAIHSALGEVTAPLIGSTITPIVVFLPLIAITGVTGVFFRALASWLESCDRLPFPIVMPSCPE